MKGDQGSLQAGSKVSALVLLQRPDIVSTGLQMVMTPVGCLVALGLHYRRLSHCFCQRPLTVMEESVLGRLTVLCFVLLSAYFWHSQRQPSIAASTACVQAPSPAPSFTLPKLPIITPSNICQLKPFAILNGPTSPGVSDVAFSPDNRILGATDFEGNVQIWNVATGVKIAYLIPERRELMSSGLAFSPDGTLLVSSNGLSLLVWALKDIATQSTPRPQNVLQAHTSFIRNITFSRDGKTIASRDDNGITQLWEAASGKNLTVFQSDAGGPGRIVFNSDGTLLIAASTSFDTPGLVQIWDVKTTSQLMALKGSAPIALSPDGTLLAVSSGDKYPVVLVYEMSTGKQVMILKSEQGLNELGAIAFSPDGKIITAGSIWNYTTSWEARTGKQIGQFDNDGVSDLSYSTDGTLLASGNGGSGVRDFVTLWAVQ